MLACSFLFRSLLYAVRGDWLPNAPSIEIESLCSLYQNAARHAQSVLIDRIRREAEADRKALAAERKQTEAKEVARQERDLCKICFESAANAVFVPCGHLCCCLACAKRCALCPHCRAQVTALPVFS